MQTSRNRPGKPSKFLGDKKQGSETLHTWIFSTELYLRLTREPEPDRVPLAGLLVGGDALRWYETRSKSDKLPSDWTTFTRDLTATFETVNSNKRARDKLAALYQKGSILLYCNLFNSTFLQISDMGEAEAKDRFIRGLKQRVRIEVELKETTSLKQAQEIAERYDSLTYEAGASGSNRAYGGRNTGQYYPSAPRMQYSGPAPMDVGAMNVGRDARAQFCIDARFARYARYA